MGISTISMAILNYQRVSHEYEHSGIQIRVGGLEHDFFPYIGHVIIPTDFHIFQRGRYTTNQLCYSNNFKYGLLENPPFRFMISLAQLPPFCSGISQPLAALAKVFLTVSL